MGAVSLRTISWGVGVQSTALVVLAAQGHIDYRVALFANVGDDSEDPLTLAYFRDHARPWAESHGIEVHELKRRTRDGQVETLLGRITKPGARSMVIPVRRSMGGPPMSRSCTADFKARVLQKWLKGQGATAGDPATVAIGISTDEVQRISGKAGAPHERIEYPLIDLDLDRSACAQIIVDAGLPPAPASSCWFCPFHRPQTWAELRRDRLHLFDQAVALESHMTAVQGAPVYLTRFGVPLDYAVATAQDTLPWPDGPEGCDSGHCWT